MTQNTGLIEGEIVTTGTYVTVESNTRLTVIGYHLLPVLVVIPR